MAINWITKTSGGVRVSNDVRLKVTKIGKAYKTCITLSNRWGDTISKTGCVKVGIDGSKVYFKDSVNGYKLDKSGESSRLYVRSDELLAIARERGGDYPLNKDKVNGLWFVETNIDGEFNKYK